MIRVVFVAISFLCIHAGVRAQLSEGGAPYSQHHALDSEVPVVVLPAFDTDSARLAATNAANKAFTFAKAFEVGVSMETAGVWDFEPDGTRVWRMGFYSQGAYSLNLILNRFKLPPGARLYIYKPDYSEVLGGYGYTNNTSSGILAVSPLQGDALVVEYVEPPNPAFAGQFEIARIAHDYMNVFGYLDQEASLRKILTCHIDVNCAEGADWQDEKRAVCKLIIDGMYLCTGALINNTAFDQKPYVLTANHCVTIESEAPVTVFYFGYEKAVCGGNKPLANKSISGATLIATAPNEKLDFTLLELSSSVPEEFMPYFAGWDRGVTPPQSSICIHHPAGDVKKITGDDDPAVVGDFGEGYLPNTHWRILEWDFGTTEGGSSGSPLFNQNHKIVGNLTGGYANCTFRKNDYYARFDISWDYYSAVSQQLAHWLDPLNTGITELSAYDPLVNDKEYDAQLIEVNVPKGEYCNISILKPSVTVWNRGQNVIDSMTLCFQSGDNPPVKKLWKGALQPLALTDIEFDSQLFDQGDYTYRFYVDSVNGMPDEDQTNDTLTSTATVRIGHQIRLDLTTDDFGNETSWAVIEPETQDTLYKGGPYLNNQTLSETFCLDEGAYDFVISDSRGDGICCTYGQGSYMLTNLITQNVLQEGGEFTFAESTALCINYSGSDYNCSGLFIYPNPANERVTLEVDNAADALVTVYNMAGMQVLVEPQVVSPVRFEIDATGWPLGLYIVKVQFAHMVYYGRLMVTR